MFRYYWVLLSSWNAVGFFIGYSVVGLVLAELSYIVSGSLILFGAFFVVGASLAFLDSLYCEDSLRWVTERRCVNAECGKVLSYGDWAYSNGRCPHCGYKSKNSVTFVAAKERGYIKKSVGDWYTPWKYKKVYDQVEEVDNG